MKRILCLIAVLSLLAIGTNVSAYTYNYVIKAARSQAAFFIILAFGIKPNRPNER